jgi:protein-S-isoprenylcysteine O-methyltransferase Ste14
LTPNLKLISTIAFVVLLAGIIYLLATNNLIANGWLGRIVQVGAAALMVWARITFGMRSFHLAANPTAGGLVTTGPYRFVRHPIYFAILLFSAAAVATRWSPANAAAGIAILAGIFGRAVSEEKLVSERYPAYFDYARRTKRLIPFIY